MKNILFSLFIMTTCFSLAQDTDEKEINQSIETLVEGWQAGDGKLFASPFSNNATFKTWFGLEIEGKEAIAEGHSMIFKYFYANTVWDLKVDRIRFLSKDIALAYCSGAILKEGESKKSEPDCVPLAVFQKKDDTWRIVSFQNTLFAVGEGGRSPGEAGLAKMAIWDKIGKN